jgi:hypothetical protein
LKLLWKQKQFISNKKVFFNLCLFFVFLVSHSCKFSFIFFFYKIILSFFFECDV